MELAGCLALPLLSHLKIIHRATYPASRPLTYIGRSGNTRYHMNVFCPRRSLSICLLATSFALLTTLRAELPKVALFTTGGTIQSKGANRDKLYEYSDGKVTPKELLDDFPELSSIANIETT